MIFTQQDRLTALETRWCPDPWGIGIELEIAHISYPPYQEWVAKNLKTSDFAQAQKRLMHGVATIRATVPEDRQGEAIARYLTDNPLEVEITKRDVRGIALLIRNWRGEAEEYTHERAVEMLQLEHTGDGRIWITPKDVKLGEGDELLELPEGMILGAAIANWVLWEAGRIKKFREERIEEMEGESDASSGGSSRPLAEAKAG